jgi:hypothetical protein
LVEFDNHADELKEGIDVYNDEEEHGLHQCIKAAAVKNLNEYDYC